jgi:hypothetical protein
MHDLDRQLGDPGLYATAIERMAEHPERHYDERLSILRLREQQGELTTLLARAVAEGSYALGPVREKSAWIAGKQRRLYVAGLLDTVVLFALASLLSRVVEPRLSRRLFSYRRGRSDAMLLNELGAYVRAHRQACPEPQQRGLYVVRADVAAYGDSIRVDDASPLWSELRTLTEACAGARFYALVQRALRPIVHGMDGSSGRRERGVPTGSPLQPAICNLYLTPLDQALGAVEGGFYGRFGDDLLFAHPDASIARGSLGTLERRLGERGLKSGEAKRDLSFFSATGRPGADWPEARGAQHVFYLGARLDFSGRVGLHPRKFRDLLLALKRRVTSADELLAQHELERDERLRLLCSVVNATLDPRSLTADRRAVALAATSDRSQLAELDYLIALFIAERVSQRRGPRAFRDVPYHELRAAGLWSATHFANAGRRR